MQIAHKETEMTVLDVVALVGLVVLWLWVLREWEGGMEDLGFFGNAIMTTLVTAVLLCIVFFWGVVLEYLGWFMQLAGTFLQAIVTTILGAIKKLFALRVA